MNLAQGIREAINLFGAEVINSERMMNVLSDLQAFEFKASRTILRAMINADITKRLYDKYIRMDDVDEVYLSSVTMQVTQQGFQAGHTQYVVNSLAKALGWIEYEPLYLEENKEKATIMTREFEVNGVKFNLCEIIGGKFSMGATPEQGIYGNFDERPAVEVEIDSFSLGETPVTQELWKALMPNNPSHCVGDKRPVERVTWEDAIEFIDKLNAVTGERFRLPTEAEWEFAARGGNVSCKTKYAGADDDTLDDYAWHKENSQSSTHDVKGKQPNELGLYDMSGNVSEWCHDWYYPSYANSTSNINPQGPATGTTKVLRGGSWNDKPINCRVSKRHSLNPSYRNKQIGFRLALS